MGYRRISTPGEKSEEQLAGQRFDAVFEDRTSGRETRRPELEVMLRHLSDGDTLVCESMDRLGRTLGELSSVVAALVEGGTRVEFVRESIRFGGEGDAVSRLMLKLLGACADFEISAMRERRRTGIGIAKAEGKYKGRKAKLTAERAQSLRIRAAAGESKTMLAKEFGISRETLYAYLRRG